VNLTVLVATINAWNGLAISFRSVPLVKAKATAAQTSHRSRPREGLHRSRAGG
jgi:hypothetical protein